jgi:hypothetical protein
MMATITGFSVVDEAGLPILADPFGNNVAFRCLGCGAPVLAIVLPSQRGSSPENPAICPACESRYWVEHQGEARRLVVRRVVTRVEQRLTLHDEIRAILLEHGKKLSTVHIAREVNKRSRYHKKDGSAVTTL